MPDTYSGPSALGILNQANQSMFGPTSGGFDMGNAPQTYTPQEFMPSIGSQMNAAAGGGGGGFWDSGTGSFLKNFGMGALNDLSYLGKLGQTATTAIADPIASLRTGQPINTVQDIRNIWATPNNDINKNAISSALGESPNLSHQWYAPSNFLDVASTFLSPAGEVSAAVRNGANMIRPAISGINDAMRGERGLGGAISGAQDSAAQQASDLFNQNMGKMQTQEAVNSAQKGNFSLADMLNRTPEAQRTFMNTANDVALNQQEGKGTIPSLLRLQQLQPTADNRVVTNISRQYPDGFTSGAYTGRLQDEGQQANRTLQQLFNAAQQQSLPPGREQEALHDIWSRIAPKDAPGLDQLVEQLNKYRSNEEILNNATQQTLQKFKYGVSPFQFGKPEPNLVFNNASDSSNPFAAALNKEMNAVPKAEGKPFNNPYADVLNPDSVAKQLTDAITNAKGGAALQTMREFADNKNPFQSLVSKGQDSFNRLFNLSGALKDQMPHYYDYLSNKDYRTGQAAKDIIDTLGQHSPQDLNEFRLARDAGEIGPGHRFEGLNNAYDALLNKYTGADVASGLDRGHLNNYVPRIMDVDKGNLQSVKRALGSDSLGGFAEDRTDTRPLRQIIQDEGRDPYKNDMYDITMSRLQKSVNAQESRTFINNMVNDGKAVKFENSQKAFSSPLYDKASTGVYVDPITKEAYVMPKDTAGFLNKEHDYGGVKNYLGGLDAINSIARRLMITNPLVHFPHNILTSIPNALNEAGASGANVLNPSWWAKGTNASPELLDEMERMGVLRPDYMPGGETKGPDLAQAAKTQDMNPVQRWLSDLNHQSRTGGMMDRVNDTVNTAMRPIDALTWGPEHAARVAVYQTAKEMGSTPEEAAAIINRNFGTNTKTLTPFEKNVMTRAFTFYPWLKHILTLGPNTIINNAGIAGKTVAGLQQANEDFSGHPMTENPTGYGLKLDLGYKDAKGNEVFTDPYLPAIEVGKALQNPAAFLYNRLSQSISTPANLLANREFGPLSPSNKQIVDQGQVDAGLQNPTGARLGYVLSRMFSGPTQEVQAATGNVGNDSTRSLLAGLGARTSTYNPDAANIGLKIRGINAAKAEASYDRKNGIPASRLLKRQEQGRVTYQINNP